MGHFEERLQVGCSCSVRAFLVSGVEENRVLLRSMSGWNLDVPKGVLDVPGDGVCFTLCRFRVVSLAGDAASLEPELGAFVLGHVGEPVFHSAIELCCGLGGISTGASLSGLTVLGGLDISPWAVEVFNLNHQHGALIADLANLDCASMISNMVGRRSVGVLFGFPCPPFSTMGDQNGFGDPRAMTLVHGLDLAYLVRASFLLLECTPRVEAYAEVVQCLESFSKMVGFQWYSKILHLDEAWPTRRTRWWCLILPPKIGDWLSLKDLPRASQFQHVGSIFADWPLWSSSDEKDLMWDLDELRFHEQYAVVDDLMLQMGAKCPTLLHSSGHLDRKCPCGCRKSGLSHSRLLRDGICAVCVTCQHEEGVRHLHPSEAAYLCSFPANFRFPRVRDALPLVGQSAAPLQAAWMLSQLQVALCSSDGIPLDSCPRPENSHAALQTHLIQLAYHLWSTKVTQVDRSVTLRFQRCRIVFEVAPGGGPHCCSNWVGWLGRWPSHHAQWTSSSAGCHLASWVLRCCTFDFAAVFEHTLLSDPVELSMLGWFVASWHHCVSFVVLAWVPCRSWSCSFCWWARCLFGCASLWLFS